MSCSKDETLQLWDIRDSKSSGSYNTTCYGRSVTWNPTSTIAAELLSSDEIHVIDTRNLSGEVKNLKFPLKNIRKIRWSKDGQFFFASSSTGIVYILDGNAMSLKAGVYPLEAHPYKIFDLDTNSKGFFATGSADSTVSIWDTTEFICQTQFSNSEDPIRSISFNDSGEYIASASDSYVCINRTDNGSKVFSQTIGDVKAIAWNPKLPLLAFGYEISRNFDKGAIEIIDVQKAF